MPRRLKNSKNAKRVRIWCGMIEPWAPFALFIDDGGQGDMVRVYELGSHRLSRGGLGEMTMAAKKAPKSVQDALVRELKALGFKPRVRHDWRERYFTVAEQGMWGTIRAKKF